MRGYINGIDFNNLEAEKYWAPTKNTNLEELVKNAIFSGDYIGSRKIDGHWAMLIKDEDGNLILRGRSESVNGGYLDKIDWVPHLKEEFNKLPNKTVLIGELYFNGNEGSRKVTTILGCLKEKAIQRQEKGDKLSYYVFDCLALGGDIFIDTPLALRASDMADIKFKLYKHSKYINFAEFYKGEDLLDFIAYCREQGWEGTVLQRKDGTYEPGKRPTRKSIKVKKELDKEIDCFLTGNYKESTWAYTGQEVENWKYWFDLKNNQKKEGLFYDEFQNGACIEPITKGAFNGWSGAIEIGVLKEDEVIPIGWISNVTEEVKRGIKENNELWKGKPVKVTAMMIEDDSHKLRHAKIMEWREDIWMKDCTWDKVFGGE